MECCENCPNHKWFNSGYSNAMYCDKADKEHETTNILDDENLVPEWCPCGYAEFR